MVSFSKRRLFVDLQPTSEGIQKINAEFFHYSSTLQLVSCYESVGMQALGVESFFLSLLIVS